MTIDDVKKELERSARLTGKDVFVEAYKIITEQEKENEKLEQLNAIQCDAWQKVSDENESLVMENNSNLRYNSALRKENKKLKEEIKQAQIDVLNELKERIKTAIDTYFNLDGGGYYLAEDAIDDIDELIKEVQNAEDKS